MTVEEIETDSLPGLTADVLRIAAGLDPDRLLWFRGIQCDRFELLPKIMRDGKDIDQVFEREIRLLTRFRQRSMAYWPAGYPQNDWEHLFAMQHYGLPTRLLDWSENVFVAAHFAVAPSDHPEHDGPCVPAIWCVDPVGWNRHAPPLAEYGDDVFVLTTADDELDAYHTTTRKKRLASPVAMFGAHNSDRIVAQRGTFMIWGKDTSALETFAGQAGSNLWRIRLTSDREQLSKELEVLGFTETMVFPELPYLAVELTRMEGWR